VATLNADGLKSNIIYITELLTKCDILLLQEHWLHNYEKALLKELLPDHNYHIKCYDDNSLDPPLHRTKGHAGVMTIWHPDLNHAITQLPDGSTRMVVLQLRGKEEILTIINTYMPADGSRDKDLLYEDVLDEVYTVLEKYASTTLIWGGDLNGSLSRDRSRNDKLLKTFCIDQGLNCPPGMMNIPTYHHFAGNVKSSIDMFLFNDNTRHQNSDFKIEAREASNVGPHDPVIVKLDFIPTQQKAEKAAGNAVTPRVNWAKVDMTLYKELTESKLTTLGRDGFEKLDPEVLVSSINNILVDSAHKAAGVKVKKKSTKKRTTSPWGSELKPLVKASKMVHYHWKRNKTDPLFQLKRKAAKKLLRTAQRRLAARLRESEQQKIMATQVYDKQEFFRLVAKQRGQTQQQVSVDFPNTGSQLEGWRDYFQCLATPDDKEEYDDYHYDSMMSQLALVEDLNSNSDPLCHVSVKDIKKHVTSLKNGKAADIYGVTAEHLKFAAPVLFDALEQATNNTLDSGKLCPQYKLGVLTPVPKPGKDAKKPDSYRRITICSIVGKVVEKELTERIRTVLDPVQSSQQFGFTSGRSPTLCALMLTEAISEALDKKETLYITYLDAKKAFDTVWHCSMLMHLHQHGVTGNLWNIFRDMYTNVKSCVKSQGMLSEDFQEHQGIRQGGLSSTDLFKVKSNNLLQRASTHPVAYRIGITQVGAPTTADDTALVTSSQYGAQVLVGIAQQDANTQRYSFNEQKSKVMVVNQKPVNPEPQVKLNGKYMDSTRQERHLGIERIPTNSAKATVESRIKEARRSIYRLAGAGMYGYNGVGPLVSLQMLKVYVIPILTYGLEALILKNDDYHVLEQFYRTALRRIQHLPENTAIPSIYLLLGCIPLEGLIHQKLLTFFAGILRRPGSIEYDVIRRQLAVKDLGSNSWVVQIRNILTKYGLPSAYKLIESPPGKTMWKHQVYSAVGTFWMEDLKTRARTMKTLTHLEFEDAKSGQVAHVWRHNSDPLEAQMATVKARLLVQRYPLGYSHCAGLKKTKVCALCGENEETIEHFVLVCTTLSKSRDRYVVKLKSMLVEHSITACMTGEMWLTVVLTPSKIVGEDLAPMYEQLTRRLIYKLHVTRSALLGSPMRYCDALKK